MNKLKRLVESLARHRIQPFWQMHVDLSKSICESGHGGHVPVTQQSHSILVISEQEKQLELLNTSK